MAWLEKVATQLDERFSLVQLGTKLHRRYHAHKNLRWLTLIAFTASVFLHAPPTSAESCTKVDKYGKGSEATTVYHSSDGLISFIADMDINTDGSLESYKIDDLGHRRADGRLTTHGALNTICNGVSIRNAQHKVVYSARSCFKLIKEFKRIRDFGWLKDGENYVEFYGIELKKKEPAGRYRGVPCTHGDAYVSQVARPLSPSYGDCKPEKWLDAMAVPAIVLPLDSKMRSLGVSHHDLAMVRLKGDSEWVGAVVGDTNPSKVGEITVIGAMKLRGKPKPRNYRESVALSLGRDTVEYVVFPGSAAKISNLSNESFDEIEAAVSELVQQHGLSQRIPVCD